MDILDPDRINEQGAELERKGAKAIIARIGGGFPCSFAKSFNMDYVNIISMEETVRDIVSRTWSIVDYIYDHKYANSILTRVLDHVHDAVVAVDKDDNVILFSERAEELFQKDKSTIVNSNIRDSFPELSFISEALADGKRLVDEIVNINNIVVNANVSLIEVDDQIEGVLCIFQDITKLQGLEKKIRYKLNKKGLTARYKFSDILTNNSLMKKTIARASKIGMSDSTAILYGADKTSTCNRGKRGYAYRF